jgi:molecular chaperone Hsp33
MGHTTISTSPIEGVAAFQLDGAAVLGRAARTGPGALDPILRRHDYPWPVALVLGEALLLAALLGGLLKSPGKVTIQAQGDGPVGLMVGEWSHPGALRGYARVKKGVALQETRYAPAALFGAGSLAITIELLGEGGPIQGIVPLEGVSLAACAEAYFERSAQTPTKLALAVGEEYVGSARLWRGAGLLLQRMAGDFARGDAEEDWRRAGLLFDTVTDGELVDPNLPMAQLLYRLFHEEGVRLGQTQELFDLCTCDPLRLAAVMRQFNADELAELTGEDGVIEARCQFCARTHRLAAQDIAAGPSVPAD